MTFTEALLRVFSAVSLPIGALGVAGTGIALAGSVPYAWLWLWIPTVILGLFGTAYLYWKEQQK
jgi:lipopolysaccharide export LptBFGC system permease protein LptF